MSRTLILAYPNCILFEILPASQRLDARFPVRLASPDGNGFRDRSGLSVKADCSFADVVADDYACVLVPGGDPDEIIGHPDVARIIRLVHGQGGVVAGICAGVAVLGQTGVLRDRRIAHNYTEHDVPAATRVHTDPLWRNTTYVPEGVSVDARVVTARPERYNAFAAAVSRACATLHDAATVPIPHHRPSTAR